MINTPVRLVTKGLKSEKITEVNHTAGTILANTDWYVTRKVERNVDIPENVVTHRAAIVTEVNRVETALAEVKNVESLIKVLEEINWDVL
jgi:glutathione synthase/RimK-type ligase-like ATP-grasp enzyme